ncbi:type II toxin-antitoxin system RnlA family toxin, partial [Leptospira interrogans]|uniref:type II toxin-antitoxin system RnlA family toxin n=2 Tax=Pseudomonadati TaxID=3379134 RepID=UPI004035B587
HGDSLVVTHHSSLRLQIQGRPLTCYRKLVYLMTDILDMSGLELVLSRREESVTEIIRQEVAADFLRKCLPKSYDNLPSITKNLLLAGQCVKIASPALPEYSMLFFPELRSLEGALKAKLASYNFDSDSNDFGYFFSHVGNGVFELDRSFDGHITNQQTRNMLGRAYTFFNKHRHGLFHMQSVEEASRQITSIEQLLSLSADAYIHLDNLYS